MAANAVVKATDDERIARPLRVLVPLIKSEIELGDEAGLEHYQRAGEMLLEAQTQVDHGDWGSWLERNFNRSISTAYSYMALAKKKIPAGRNFTTLSEHTRPNRPAGGHVPTWHPPVQKILNNVDTETLNLKREEMKRADERDAQRTLALQLIDIGYKVLARKLHPDRGGSRDAMQRLNAVRDRLKQYV